MHRQPRTRAAVLLAAVLAVPMRQSVGEDANPAGKASSETSKPARARNGLVVLYDFATPSGPTVHDRSGIGTPINLTIANPNAVRRSAGALEVRGDTIIKSDKPPTRLTRAIKQSGAVTIEAWVRPAKVGQEGPARIVTLSRHATERNFTVGQDGNTFDVRFRTNRTNSNGIPSLSSPAGSLTQKLSHVVYSRARDGQARLFLNGKQVAQRKVSGTLTPWTEQQSLALANELTGDRPWRGAYHLVAIYSRALSPADAGQNFRAGPGSKAGDVLAQRRREQFFQTKVAPLLANHCLECHDAASKKGGLDLSTKVAAMTGGESGVVVFPGKPDTSPLLEAVASGSMPKKRPPLSTSERATLRKWIAEGAVWSLSTIDPILFAHDGRAGQRWVQRLTVAEYIETVRAALGVDIAKEARAILPPDLRADGFSNTAYNLNVDLKHIDAYARLAGIVVERLNVGSYTNRFHKSRRLIDKDNRALIAGMGQWLLRGPLEEHEIVAYRGIATTVASAGGNFDEAMGYVIEAMLQSPRFVYRIENQRGDGTAWPVSDFELASRLSYIIWGGPPDEALLKAADDGRLDRISVAAEADRMLKDPRARALSKSFVSEWLNLGRLDNIRPDRQKFPNWDPALAIDMKRETTAFFEEVVWNQNRPLSDLLNAQITFATPRLASHYRLPVPKTDKPSRNVAMIDLSSTPGRGGLLTHGSVLTVGGDEASMVSRGLFVLHDLLRGTVKDPPPCVDTTPVPTRAGLTQRGIAEARIANANCGGCHSRFEPLAFGLEKFDGLGTYHDRDKHGNELRDDGEILFPGSPKPLKYQSAAELMNLLANSDRVRQSITWKVAQFSLGRPLVAEDAPILDKIHKAAQANGGTWPSLIKALVTSDLVMMSTTEATTSE